MYGMCDGKTSYVALSRGMREAVQHCIIIYSNITCSNKCTAYCANFNPARLKTIFPVQVSKFEVQITRAILLYSLTLLDNSKLQ